MDEFTVRLAPKLSNQKHTVFKLHKDDNITWNESKMRRDNDYQPWQIKAGSGKTSRRYKAIKEGGVGDNASYFVFYKSRDNSGAYEVCPIDEWYSVSATQRYKTLTAEDAEQKFEQRHKMLNLFSVMHLKKTGENGDEGGPSQDRKSFKVSEMDDWDESGDDEASDNDDGGEDSKKKLKRKKVGKKEKEDADDAPDEAKEDSDEGDFEQREVDYMSDLSSDSSDPEVEKDVTDVKGIAEEDALRDLLDTEDEEDEENPQQKGSKSGDSKTGLGTLNIKQDPDGSDDSSDSDIYDVDEDKMDDVFMKKGLPSGLATISKQDIKQEPESSNNSHASKNSGNGPGTSNSSSRSQPSIKRKAPESSISAPQPAQRPRLAPETPSSPANGQERVVEDLIRKYLSRRPMTLKSLLKDIKSKLKRIQGNELDNDELVQTIANILKRLPIEKEKINDITYLSLRS